MKEKSGQLSRHSD